MAGRIRQETDVPWTRVDATLDTRPLRALTLGAGEQRTVPLRDTTLPARWFIEVRRGKVPHAAVTLTQPFPYALPEGFLEVRFSTYGQATGVTSAWPIRRSRTFWVYPVPEVPFRWETVHTRTHPTRTSRIQERTDHAVVTNPYGSPRTFRILLPEPVAPSPSLHIRDLRWDPPPDSVLQRGTARFGVWWRTLRGGDSLEIRLRMKVVRPR